MNWTTNWEKVSKMTEGELVELVEQTPRLSLPYGWRERPRFYQCQIVGAMNCADMSNDEYERYTRDAVAVLQIR